MSFSVSTSAARGVASTVGSVGSAIASPAVRLRGVTVMYDDRVSLNDVTVEFASGQMTAVAGSNGSGKSTLLGAIAGVVPLSGGTVELVGGSVELVAGRVGGSGEVRDEVRVAYVAQRSSVPDHLPLSVQQVVEMGRWSQRGAWRRLTRDDRDIVASSISAVGLQGFERRPLSALSGGQRQRALVGQGLAQRAQVLLLDEPTVGLDTEACELIALALAAETLRGTAVIHATHDTNVIDAADRVLRLEQGRIV
jgi:zinc/manganese transport system ATP-binding protein